MNDFTELTVFGRDHETRGTLYSACIDAPTVALGTSVGITSKPNEDAVGACVLGLELVLAIADGHWGREASELAVSKAVQLLRPEVRPSKDSETRARLYSLYEQVNTELYEMATSAPGAATPETTLIVCHVKETAAGKYLYWSSFGDSYLFLLRDGAMKQLNTLNPFWLGYLSKMSETAKSQSLLMRFLSSEARYVGVASGLETGIELLQPADVLFLCTDGLVGSDENPDPGILNVFAEILKSQGSMETKVQKLISSALERGEVDNISCLVAQV